MLAVSVSSLTLVSVGVFKELGALVRCFLARQLRPTMVLPKPRAEHRRPRLSRGKDTLEKSNTGWANVFQKR